MDQALVVEVGLKTEVEPEKCRARVEWRAWAEQGNNLEQTGQEITKVELKTTVEQAEQSTTAEPAEPKTMMKPRKFRYDLRGRNRADRGHRDFRDGFSGHNRAGRESRDSVLGRDRAGKGFRDGLLSEHREFKSGRCLGRSCSGCSRLGRSMRA